MGGVIKHWVQTRLGLPMPESSDSEEIGRSLSNGYLIAEILRKYNYISDDQLISLGRSLSEKTKRKNMQCVAKWMAESGFRVKSAELLDILEEIPGAGIKFLYRLYFLLESSTLHGQLNDKDTKVKEKPQKREKKLKNVQKLDSESSDLQIETKESTSIQEIKKSTEKVASIHNSTDICGIPLQKVKSQIRSKKPKRKKIKDCVETEKYFTKKLPCDQPKPKSMNSVQSIKIHEISSCPSPKESKALKKLMECNMFPNPNPNQNLAPVGTVAESTNLYFASKAILKAKSDEHKALQLACKTPKESKTVPAESTNDFKLSSILESQNLERLKAKVKAEYRLAKDMKNYDQFVQDPNEDEDNEYSSPVLPSFRSMQLKMQKIKCTRKQEAENVAERARLRKAIFAKMIKEIPSQMYEDLTDTAMKATMTICDKEAELAEFLTDTYQEKTMFYNHMKHEETALQRIRSLQEDKLAMTKVWEVELQLTVAGTADRYAERVAYETLMAQDETDAVDKTKTVRDMIDTAIHLAMKISRYRSATGNEPPKKLLQEWKISIEFLLESGDVLVEDWEDDVKVDVANEEEPGTADTTGSNEEEAESTEDGSGASDTTGSTGDKPKSSDINEEGVEETNAMTAGTAEEDAAGVVP